ncbi:PRC-barrel domain containing protein [Saliphagus sp. GCM10025308]
MSARFTDDDEGKPVVNENGDRIGMVESVHGDTAHVNPDPGMTDTIKSKLGWGDASEDTYELDASNVDHIGDDEIRLGQL